MKLDLNTEQLEFLQFIIDNFEYNDDEDLIELLDLSNKNFLNKNGNSWQKVLPLYPISPIN